MKKQLLIPLLFLLFGCSSDEIGDENQANTIDPFIGTWLSIYSEGTTEVIMTINENGTGSDVITKSEYQLGNTYQLTWKNLGDNLNSLNQTYRMMSIGYTADLIVTYNSDFTKYSYTYDGIEQEGNALKQ